MPKSAELTAAVAACLEAVPKVVSDLQGRPDYGTSQKQAVATLDAFKQSLLTLRASEDPDSQQLDGLCGEAGDTVLPLLGQLIADNTAMSKMGQLNTGRTITPEMALAHNTNLAKLQDATQGLVAVLSAQDSGGPPPASPPDWDSYAPEQIADELPAPGAPADMED